jgi:glycosyltransferase involved in cell wall biosynthesis
LRQEMGARGRQKAEEYSWQNIAQSLQQYYDRLLDGVRWQS